MTLPGAVRVDPDAVDTSGLSPDRDVVAYDSDPEELVSARVAATLNQARASGHRCVAVGTTALRTLESAATPAGTIEPVTGPTDIFIQPGYKFRAIDALVTNFHLPKSSLFMLVSALMGTDVMQAAYAHAIAQGYRFYSYGDACLLLP